MSLGCEHYKRKVRLMMPCCNKIYTCRFCHDANENHEADRKLVASVVCLVCGEKQRVRMSCSRCGIRFGQYFCLKCRLYDDTDKKQFHCEECGVCRVGGRESFLHCSTCNMCYNVLIFNIHKCIPNVGKDKCGLCLESLHTSVLQLKVPTCGHLIHEKCSQKLIENRMNNCPICRKKFDFVL